MVTAGTTEEVPNATFRLVGGDPVLDFVNTASWYQATMAGGRDYFDRIGKERLVVAGDLIRFGVTAGLISADAGAGRALPSLLPRARALRHGIHRLFKGVLEGWPAEPDDLVALDRELAPARAAQRLDVRGTAFDWAWRGRPTAADTILWTLALRAASLLTSEELVQVGECSGVECGWLFLDTSRNHSRRWCEMADCGNLAKVRRFRGRAR